MVINFDDKAVTLPLQKGITVTVPTPTDFTKPTEIKGEELSKYLSANARKVGNSLLVNATIKNEEITALAYIYTP